MRYILGIMSLTLRIWIACGITVSAMHGHQALAEDGGVAARVLGQTVVHDNAEQLRSHIESVLLADYADANFISAKEDEINAAERALRHPARTTDRLSAWPGKLTMDAPDDPFLEDADAREAWRTEAKRMVVRWKVHRHLYGDFGGDVWRDDSFVIPFGAISNYLHDREQAGDFTIRSPDLRREFWSSYAQTNLPRIASWEGADLLINQPFWRPVQTALDADEWLATPDEESDAFAAPDTTVEEELAREAEREEREREEEEERERAQMEETTSDEFSGSEDESSTFD